MKTEYLILIFLLVIGFVLLGPFFYISEGVEKIKSTNYYEVVTCPGFGKWVAHRVGGNFLASSSNRDGTIVRGEDNKIIIKLSPGVPCSLIKKSGIK